MISPRLMCRQHLLGEHVELHMVRGDLLKRKGAGTRSLAQRGLLEPQNIERRHAELVKEMTRRGYRHRSPWNALPRGIAVPAGKVNRRTSRTELARRCPSCRDRMRKGER